MRFGGWIVHCDGLEFVDKPFHGEGHGYFIQGDELHGGTCGRQWPEHLREKNWFTKQVEEDFASAVNAYQGQGETCNPTKV